MEIRLKDKYKNEVFKAMQDRFGYSNPMEVPKLTKITINMGLSEAKDNAKVLESAVKEIALISGPRSEKECRSELRSPSEATECTHLPTSCSTSLSRE